MNLVETIAQQFSPQLLGTLGSQLGLDQQSTDKAVSSALPMLLGALGRNAKKPGGAESLHGALSDKHDGSVLNNLDGFLSNPDLEDGGKILSHIFGSNQGNVLQGLSQTTDLDPNTSGDLLKTLAPIVLGALGQQQRAQGLDASGLATMLDGERQQADGLLGMLSGLLDADGDGNAFDDIIQKLGVNSSIADMGGNLLNGLFKK